MILNLFSSRPDHPLGDAKGLKRILAEVPLDNSFKAVDEIYGWLESLLSSADEFRVDHLFDVVRQLDETAQPHIRRLARDYLLSPRLSKSEERQRWTMSYNYWGEVSGLYARCLERATLNPKDKGSEVFKPQMPLAATRLMAARAMQLKWVKYRYGPVGEDLWRGLGQPYLVADAAGYAQKPVPLYPGHAGLTSAAQQYLQALVLHASSTDSLRPLEIELADKLIAHFLPGFVFSPHCEHGSVYWIDAASGSAPMRLARQPEQLSSSLRFFAPGSVLASMNELMARIERGDVPTDLNLGGEFPAKVVLPVLRHLAIYWAPEPPQREHPRHVVQTRVSVLQGFDDCFTVFAGGVARLGKERTAASWVVENVSLGGFGVAVDELGDSLKIGTLLSIQPEGGENWVLGVVRRYQRDADNHALVGIQSLARQARSIELRPRAAGFSATGAIPGIWLLDGQIGAEARVLLPAFSFDVRENVEFIDAGQRYLLTPVELLESGGGFEIGRYRLQRVE